MSTVSSYTECTVELTKEEREVLQKASEICKEIGKDIWQNGSNTSEEDDVAFFFSEIGDGLKNALEGEYFLP